MKGRNTVRKGLAAVVMVLLIESGAWAGEAGIKELETNITAVTVYFDHALVTREADLDLKVGAQKLVIKHLSGEINESLLQVEPPEGVKLQKLNVQRTFLTREPEGKIRMLEDEVQKLKDQIREQKDLLKVHKAEEKFLNSIQVTKLEKISAELSIEELKGPEVAAYREVLNFLTSSLIENATKVRRTEIKKRELVPQLRAKEKELAETKVRSKLEQKEVILSLEAFKPVKGKITFSYLLPGAMWFPAYDIRANLDKETVKLDYYGTIQQSTGEDWEGIDVTLAAIRPVVRAKKPELTPWYLSFERKVSPKHQRREEQLRELPQITAQFAKRPKAYRKYHKELMSNVALVQKVFTAIQARGTSILLPTTKRESIRADGKPYRVKVGSYPFKVKAMYSSTPRLSLNTHLTGKGRNTTPYPLLPGTANLFHQGSFSGKTSIDFTAPNEEAEFYLGVDESIKVVRELDYRRSKFTSFKKRKRLEFSYNLIVENFRDSTATISLHDCLPVSQDSRLKTGIIEMSLKPSERKKGLLRWDISLPPGGKEIIHYSFYIEYPQDMQLPLAREHERMLLQH